jgi:hypothetical protein
VPRARKVIWWVQTPGSRWWEQSPGSRRSSSTAFSPNQTKGLSHKFFLPFTAIIIYQHQKLQCITSFRKSPILHFLSLHELLRFHKSGAIYLSFRSPLKYFSKTLVKIHGLFRSSELTLISQKRWRQSKTLRLLLLTSFYANVQNASRRGMRPNSRYLCVFVKRNTTNTPHCK